MKTLVDFSMDAIQDENLLREFVRILKEGTPELLKEMFLLKGYNVQQEECDRIIKEKMNPAERGGPLRAY